MYDLISFGEALIDFTPCGVSEAGNPVYQQNPGGGPANMACAAAKLGVKTAFFGKVGDDAFGAQLTQTIAGHGVGVDGLKKSATRATALAFVHLLPDGDRAFTFYRENTADTAVTMVDLPAELLEDCRYFFFSSVMMTAPVSRETSFALAKRAKTSGTQVVFDPNLRPLLWESLDLARDCIRRGLALSDVVKLSEEEAAFVTGEADYQKAMRLLAAEFPGVSLWLITLGKDGCVAKTAAHTLAVPPYAVTAIDATAAGDTFTGAFVAALLETGKSPAQLDEAALFRCCRFANAAGALATTKKGGIPSLPALAEITALQEKE